MAKERIIKIEPIRVEEAVVSIEGDGELCLNAMNARTVRELTRGRTGQGGVKEVPNIWEDILTAIHWRDGYPVEDTRDLEEKHYHDMMANNAPCITGFGLKKSFCQAVVRNEIDTYATKFDNAMNVVDRLIPIEFTSHCTDETLMSPKKGSPVLAYINRFSGWSADIRIRFTENVYTLNEIVNIINLAGFGLGIGSGRPSGYGRYHVSDVR